MRKGEITMVPRIITHKGMIAHNRWDNFCAKGEEASTPIDWSKVQTWSGCWNVQNFVNYLKKSGFNGRIYKEIIDRVEIYDPETHELIATSA